MPKQDPSKLPISENVKEDRVGKRYYVQHLTEQIFVVRERMSADGGQGADDRIVRSFQILHDAYLYANSLNDPQNKQYNGAIPDRGRSSGK